MKAVADTQYTLRGAPAAVFAVLSAARAQGAVITRTKLAKLLYLADLRAVEEFGRPGSGIEWRWLNYGPFSDLLLSVEDDLVDAGILVKETTENYYGKPEHRLRLGPRPVPVDVDAQYSAVLEKVVLEYGKLAPSTLRDLTYQTAPMLEAQREGARGKVLDLLTNRPVPEISSVVAHYQAVLDELGPQENEGDLSGLVDEVEDWAPERARATRHLVDNDLCRR